MKTVRGLVLGVLVGALLMTAAPAMATFQANNPSGDGVQPKIISHYSGDDCADPAVDTEATQSLLISTVKTGNYTDSDTGVVINLVVNKTKKTFDFTINTPGWVAYDVVVKGLLKANHYDYLASSAGAQASDTLLHAPPLLFSYDALDDVTFCYEELPVARSVSGLKFHDRDTDGVQDDSEEGLANWTITAFQDGEEVASAVTDADGNYSMELGSGTFVVCEVLEDAEAPFVWQESAPSGNEACTGLGDGLAPAGHTVILDESDVTGVDFGNHLAVVLGCGDSATLDEEGMPSATVTLSATGCSSPERAYPFDAGVDSDEGYTQFVVFGGAPDGTVVFTEEIDWLPYFLELPARRDAPDQADLRDPRTGRRGSGWALTATRDSPTPMCPTAVRFGRSISTSQPPGSEFDVQVDEFEVWQFLGDPTRGKR